MKKYGAACALALALALTGCAAATQDDDSTANGGSNGGSTASGPHYTTAQQNAIRSAKQYLSMGTGFSRAGLIDQLSAKVADGYKRPLAVFAVNHIKVDYNRQAVIAAKAYMQMQGFSRAGLISQLTSKAGSKFTRAQAEYAANKVGL